MNILNRNIFLLLGLIALAAIVYYFSDIVAYILIAWVLSMLGRPLVVFYRTHIRIRRFRMGASTAAMFTILTFYALLTGLLLIFVPTIVAQARNLSTVDYQAIGEKLRPMFFNLDVQLHQIGLLTPGESLATKTQDALFNWFKPTLVGDFLSQFLGVAGNIVVTFASVTFILFFFLQDNRLFTDIIHAIVPDHQEQKVHTAVNESSDVLTRYFRGLLIQLTVFSVATSLILWLLGVKNAVLIGAFGGVFNVIPYIGPILGILFGTFITVSSNLDVELALLLPMLVKVAITFFTVQAIDNNFVGPVIMSKSVQAHPLEIFIVTLIAAKIGGVVGMVIGIPVYTVLRVIARNFFSQFKLVQRLTERLDE
ncbi:MAG: AI-2E family transporter [Phycisphaerae bacterium]|nr:AI-2E family transporter [Saprospiraceae bacterium]